MDETLDEQQDVMLQRIFAACQNFAPDLSDCSCTLSSSLGDSSSAPSAIKKTSVASLIERLRESWIHGDKLLEELRKFLNEVSYNGQVCFAQFEEACRRLVAMMSRVNVLQDGNNNVGSSESEGRYCRDFGSNGAEKSIVINHYAAGWYDDVLSCSGSSANNRNNAPANPEDNVSTELENCRGSSSERAVDIGLSSRTDIAMSPMRYELIGDENPNSMKLEVSEFEFRQRARKYDEENSALREELTRVEECGEALRKRISLISRQLERAEQRCRRLEKENDDQREILEASERQGRECRIEVQRIKKQRAALADALEKAETEKQNIPTLAAKLEVVTREKLEYFRRLGKSQEKLGEKELECQILEEKIAQLEKNDWRIQESYETTVHHLRSEIRELQGQVAQLQMDRLLECQCDGLSLTPPMGNASAFIHARPCNVAKIEPENSLCAELQASGFFCERRMNDSKFQELEEEVRQTLELFDKLTLELCSPFLKKESRKTLESDTTPDIEMLRQKALLLFETARQLFRGQPELKDASVQVRAESSTAQRLSRLSEWNIPTFEDRVQWMRSQQEELEARKYQGDPLTSRLASPKEKLLDASIPRKNCRTANVFCASETIQNQTHTVDTIIGPIVAAIDEIIQGSPAPSSEVDSPRGEGDSRHRCRRYAYTLPASRKRSLSRAPVGGPGGIETLASSGGDGPERKEPVGHVAENIVGARQQAVPTGHFEPEELDLSLQNLSINTESLHSSRHEGDSAECSSPRENPPVARRKISVFRRSFDLDTFQNKVIAETMSSTGSTAIDSPIEAPAVLAGNHRIQSYRLIVPDSESSSCPSTFEYDTTSPEEDGSVAVNSAQQKETGFVLSAAKLCLSPFYEMDSSLKKERESEVLQESIHTTGPPRTHLSSTEDFLSKVSSSEVMSDETSSLRRLQPQPQLKKKKKKNERDGDGDGNGNGNEERNSGGRKTEGEKASADPAVALAMSSGEDSSDSESDPIVVSEKPLVQDETQPARITGTVDGAKLASSTPIGNSTAFVTFTKIVPPMSLAFEITDSGRESTGLKRERLSVLRRSLSESEGLGCGVAKCCSRCISPDPLKRDVAPAAGASSVEQRSANRPEERVMIFPSLTDARLQESGIGRLPDGDEFGPTLSEEELEQKYTALSVGLGMDRVTLPKRMALSLRHRDQAERNLGSEVHKMHQDIQALAPLCIDRESVERVERVRQQLEMIAQCAHIVSCAAETLGAVHQEQRISRAAHLADRYLRVLRARCDKLASELTETKRVLTENNIVVEESPSELGDDVPRLRYRSVPTNNRTMMTRRRASIATISRPAGTPLDQEGTRQRNSVSGRMTMRRPSLSYDVQKWENDKLDRTDSSSSIGGELREIFEQAESRRNSLEENNNLVRSRSTNLSVGSCESVDSEVWTISRDDLLPEIPADENYAPACNLVSRRTSQVLRSIQARVQARIQIPIQSHLASISIFWYLIIFALFFGFCINLVTSSASRCGGAPLKWWSIQEILGQYIRVRYDGPRAI